MTSDAEHTAAVMVAYHHRGDAPPRLRALASMVGRVIVVDNRETPDAPLREAAAQAGAWHLAAGNAGGLAGAYNRALALLRAHAPTVRQVVWLDEDSDVDALPRLLTDADVRRTLARDDTAALSAAYRDRATGLRGRYIRLGRWRLTFTSRDFVDLQPVAFVINSMSVWRLDALARIGPFNERLAIDHVDTEYGLRARAAGYRLWVHGGIEFAHAIGQRRAFRLLGVQMQAGSHPPERRWLIARNTVWLARRWGWREPAFAALCLARLGYEAVGIVMAEDRRGAKLAALLRGAARGLVARLAPARG